MFIHPPPARPNAIAPQLASDPHRLAPEAPAGLDARGPADLQLPELSDFNPLPSY